MSVDFSVQMVVMAVLGGRGHPCSGPVWGPLVLVPITKTGAHRVGWRKPGVHLTFYGALYDRDPLLGPGIDPWVRRGVDGTRTAGGGWGGGRPRSAVENAPRASPARSAAVLAAPLAANGGEAVLLRGRDRRFGGAVGVAASRSTSGLARWSA